jgi:hypothetical protein
MFRGYLQVAGDMVRAYLLKIVGCIREQEVISDTGPDEYPFDTGYCPETTKQVELDFMR